MYCCIRIDLQHLAVVKLALLTSNNNGGHFSLLRNPISSLFAALKLQIVSVQYWRPFPRLFSPDPRSELRLPTDPSSDVAIAGMEHVPIHSEESETSRFFKQAMLHVLPDPGGIESCSARLTCALCILMLSRRLSTLSSLVAPSSCN